MSQATQISQKKQRKHLSFRWETELCSSFLATAEPHIWSRQGSGNWLIIEESNCSDGRADQVWARLETGWKCEVLIENAALLMNPTISRILAALRRKRCLAEDELKATVGVSLAVLRKVLRDLIMADLVVSLAKNLYKLAKHVTFPKMEICAFEMKLDNWKRALYQSTRYRGFSHRVFVVMPGEALKSIAQNKDQFEKMGIGLMTHGTDGDTKVVVRPSKRDPRSSYQSLMALGMLLSRGSQLSFAD